VAHVPFRKYEGLGNDFIVMNLPSGSIERSAVERLCDRHFGIGADGVLLIGPPSTPRASATMTVWNADGSRPEMCGNGIRCVAIEVARQKGISEGELIIDTDAGPLACRLSRGEIEVSMGTLVDHGEIELVVEGGAGRFRSLSIGNPHAVTFDHHDAAQVDRLGPRVSTSARFPDGTNVEFAEMRADGAIDLVVWERGVGRTLACGTGACATVGAACLSGFRSFDAWTEVRLPGGKLSVRVESGSLAATLRGPARHVFQGEVDLP
jgi:diaminopimelate epimerase